ncbi:MAG: hypothetical protein Q7I99_05480 [Acholeplasmataceae bacterium]|nr:hypothetical protein [Acholeplasmataceae bacterium]
MKKSQFLLILFYISVVILGVTVFFLMMGNDNSSIYTVSFDRKIKFELAKADVENLIIEIDNVGVKTTFKVSNVDEFLTNYVYTHPNYVVTHELVNPNTNTDVSLFMFVYEGYPFILSIDLNNTFVLEPNYTTITDLGVLIPFITNYYYSSGSLITWNSIALHPFSSFLEAVAYYEKLGNFLYQVDYDQKTIHLKCVIERVDDYREYGIENFYEMSGDYAISLVFNSEGFTILLDTQKISE